MRRLLTGVARYFADLGRSAAADWRAFWFEPADPTSLGLIRIAVGVLLTWDLLTLGPDLRDYLASDGWIGPEAVRQYLAERSPGAWSFWVWVPDAWLGPAWVACLIVLASFTIGLASRTTAVLAWTIAVSTARRAPVTLFGFDQLVATWALYLAVSGASGQALSLDRVLRLRRDRLGLGLGLGLGPGWSPAPMATVSANLGLRLIQFHLALVYGSAGLAKLMGREWWDGTALEMLLLTPEFRRFDLSWMLAYPSLLALATHVGVALEIAYPVLVWVRPLRPLLLTSIATMHLGIDAVLGLTEFGLAMIAANLAFVPGERLRMLLSPPSVEPAPSANRREVDLEICPPRRTPPSPNPTPIAQPLRRPARSRR